MIGHLLFKKKERGIPLGGHIRRKQLKNGHTWQIIVEAGTGDRRKRIYRNVRGNKKDAERVMAQLQNEINSGTYIEPSKLTLGEYLQDWFKTYVKVNLSPTTAEGYRVNIEKHVIPHLGKILVQDLKPMHLQKFYYTKMQNGRSDGKGGLSAKSVLYIHRNIHEALEHAVRMQLISRNVARLVTLPKAKRYEPKVYGEDQLIKLLNTAKGTDMELAINLAAALGLRRGELLGLRWQSVDLESKRIYVRENLIGTPDGLLSKAPKSKTGIRTLDIPDGLVPILKKYKIEQTKNKLAFGDQYCEDGYVCCQGNGKPYNPGYFSKKFKKFLEDNNLPHIRLHDLRHSYATLLLKYGVQPKVASSMLGHSTISITMDLYSHVLDDMKQDVAKKVNVGIFKTTAEKPIKKTN